MKDRCDLAYLLYYEKSDCFCIELCANADRWTLPPILSSFASKGYMTVDFHWSRIWVEQRIIPPDRQNLGMILREFGLKEYDPFALLMIARGRCAQDDCYLTPLKEDAYPAELQNRLQEKICDLIPVSEEKTLLLFKNGRIDQLSGESVAYLGGNARRLLAYYRGLSELQVSPGGQGVEWAPGHGISLGDLRRITTPARMREEDLRAFVRHNLVSTGEAAALLGCSRQNIGDLIRRGKLVPVKEEKNNSLFYRADILSRLRD